MTTWNKEMTIEEARKLVNAKSGFCYPDTPHNKKMMKQAVTETLRKIRNGAQ